MMRIVAKIPRRQIMQAVPKASLGALPMLISFELGFALLAGYFAAHFFAGQKTSEQGRVPSLVFDMGDWRVVIMPAQTMRLSKVLFSLLFLKKSAISGMAVHPAKANKMTPYGKKRLLVLMREKFSNFT